MLNSLASKTSRFYFILLGFGLFSFASNLQANSYNDLEKIVKKAKSLEDFLSQKQLLSQYQKAISAYYGRDVFKCKKFEVILFELERLRKLIPSLDTTLWNKRSQEPSYVVAKTLSKDRRIRKQTFRFRPIDRKLHGIWIDPQGGNCQPKKCTQRWFFSPDRWVAALENSQQYLIESRGHFTGNSVGIVPIQNKKHFYHLLYTAGDPHIKRYVVEDKGAKVRTHLGGWLEKMVQRKKLGRKTLVELRYQKKIGRLYKVFTVTGRKNYVGNLDNFRPIDSVAKRMMAMVPRHCLMSGKTQEVNLWGGFAKSTPQKASSIQYKSGVGFAVNTNDPKVVKELLDGIESPKNPGALAFVSSKQIPELQKSFSKVLLESKHPTLREKAAIALNLLRKKLKGNEFDSDTKPASLLKKRWGNLYEYPNSPYSDYQYSEDSKALSKALDDEVSAVRHEAAIALSDAGVLLPKVKDQLSEAIKMPGRRYARKRKLAQISPPERPEKKETKPSKDKKDKAKPHKKAKSKLAPPKSKEKKPNISKYYEDQSKELDRASRAAKSKADNNLPAKKGEISSLGNGASEEKDPVTRKKAVDSAADLSLHTPIDTVVNEIKNTAEKDPGVAREISARRDEKCRTQGKCGSIDQVEEEIRQFWEKNGIPASIE